ATSGKSTISGVRATANRGRCVKCWRCHSNRDTPIGVHSALSSLRWRNSVEGGPHRRALESFESLAEGPMVCRLSAGAKEIRTHGPTTNASVPRALHWSRHCSSLTHLFEKTLQG